MDLDALRYTGFVTSPFQGNVQFDRHPTEGGGRPSPMVQSRTREAQPTSSGGLFGIDAKGGLFGMSG